MKRRGFENGETVRCLKEECKEVEDRQEGSLIYCGGENRQEGVRRDRADCVDFWD